jgi:tRNA-modifying protein YgfZ
MRISPLRKLHQLAEASMIHYGPAEADILVAETFGELEIEYAAIRKSCILLDLPQRGVIEITGKDRLSFLNRMVTQELKGLAPFHTAKTLWLNRKGRIDADLRLIELGERMLVDVDVLAADRTVQSLSAFVITEDVTIRNAGEQMHRMALHGPTGPALLLAISKPVVGPVAGPALSDLTPGAACIVSIRGHEVVVDRDDMTGEAGLELTMPGAAATDVFQSLVETGQVDDEGNGSEPTSQFRLRPAGWHAFNIARIEAGRPIYNIDFGPDSLPHETGIVRDRVSFTKGCYLGQEIVARMESRGHSKKVLMAIKCEAVPRVSPDSDPVLSLLHPLPVQPVTGSHVWAGAEPGSDPIGVVTSSTLSPMLGSIPVCFAMIKHDLAKEGVEVLVAADDAIRVRGTTQPELTFWRRGQAPA